MKLRTAIIWNAISQLGQSGITLLSTIILARMLTPDDFGIIGIVTIFIAFSQIMVDSEMGGALLRKVSVDRTDLSTLFYYNLFVSIILYCILYFLAPLIADFYNRQLLTEVIRIISITIIIHAFRVVQRIIIFRELKFKIYAIINVVSGVVSLIVAIYMASKRFGYWALVWQQIVLAICNVFFMSISTKFTPSLEFSIQSFKYQFNFGFGLLGSDIIKTIANNISTNIIAKVSSLQFTGYYTQSSRLTNFSQSTIGSIMDQSIFPLLVKMDSIDIIKKTYYKILWLICGGLGVLTLIMVLFSKFIIHIVLGSEWLNATTIFKILSIGILPVCVQILCRNILKTIGKTKLVFHLESIKSILVIIGLGLASIIGDYAIIWSLVITQTISCIFWLYFTHYNLSELAINKEYVS